MQTPVKPGLSGGGCTLLECAGLHTPGVCRLSAYRTPLCAVWLCNMIIQECDMHIGKGNPAHD